MGCTPLLAGFIFQRDAIRTYEPNAAAIFDFGKVEGGQGIFAPNSLVTVMGTSYYLAKNGFYTIGAGTGSLPLDIEAVHDWFFQKVDSERLHMVVGAVDPIRPRIYWAFPTSGSSAADLLDHVLVYDLVLKRWTHGEISTSYIFPAATPGVTLDGLAAIYPTMEEVPYPLDARIWKGGAPLLGAFDGMARMAFFSGQNMQAVVQTPEFQAIGAKRAHVNGFRPQTDALNVTGRVAGRERPMGAKVWGAVNGVDETGMIPARVSARLHTVEVSVDAGETWTNLNGVDFGADDVVEDGER
ncbi:MAG: hypothetical protein J0H94_04395 [Rhizobiales bacterium]|nr:hypothetical protein [Hyphomicrobiales bacterium]